MMYSIVFGMALIFSIQTLNTIVNCIVYERSSTIKETIISLIMIILWSIYHYMSN